MALHGEREIKMTEGHSLGKGQPYLEHGPEGSEVEADIVTYWKRTRCCVPK